MCYYFYMSKATKDTCPDCHAPRTDHILSWLDEIFLLLIPKFPIPKKLENVLDKLFEKFFIFSKLVRLKTNFDYSLIQPRSVCFIKEAKKFGIEFKAFQGPYGYTDLFLAKANGKSYSFEGLPLGNSKSSFKSRKIDDKKFIKQQLKQGKFPVAPGKSFWFWQKKQALNFGQHKIGFPLTVKPRNGSVCRHVTNEISSSKQLDEAIKHAIRFAPTFIVEKFMPESFVHRATVVDFDFVACVKQIPANVVSDGRTSIRDLIDKKNSHPDRGEPSQQKFTLFKIVENNTTEQLLKQQNYNKSSIPAKGILVWLQKDPFLKLGGDLIELTPNTHPENLQLFRDIARHFNTKVVGIDFICQDINLSWQAQPCAILELNSLPCIELHHFPSAGQPQNVARALVDLFIKYYQ
jgi:D-alanine-D-alanine ligase-like ATP-grasp enzyme